MTWPIPAEGEIASRVRRRFEALFTVDGDGNPLPETVDTGPSTPFGVLAEVADETHTELYLYQRALSRELMVDTAQDWLVRHGYEWGVPRLLPTTALGALIVVGTPGAPLPAGIEVSDQGQVWRTSVAATIPGSGAVSIPAEAEQAGTAGNRTAGVSLQLVAAVTGVTSPTVTVDVGGLRGGTDLEDAEAWRSRILARIRTRGAAGAVSDYVNWALDAGAAYVSVGSLLFGAGTVGVVVAMPGPAVPSAAELARVDAALQRLRPVGAAVTTLPAVLQPVAVTLALSPDTVGTRAAAQLGLAALFLREGRIGRVIPHSRIDAAISASAGEYAHVLLAPAGDVQPAFNQIPVFGSLDVRTDPSLAAPPDDQGSAS